MISGAVSLLTSHASAEETRPFLFASPSAFSASETSLFTALRFATPRSPPDAIATERAALALAFSSGPRGTTLPVSLARAHVARANSAVAASQAADAYRGCALASWSIGADIFLVAHAAGECVRISLVSADDACGGAADIDSAIVRIVPVAEVRTGPPMISFVLRARRVWDGGARGSVLLAARAHSSVSVVSVEWFPKSRAGAPARLSKDGLHFGMRVAVEDTLVLPPRSRPVHVSWSRTLAHAATLWVGTEGGGVWRAAWEWMASKEGGGDPKLTRVEWSLWRQRDHLDEDDRTLGGDIGGGVGGGNSDGDDADASVASSEGVCRGPLTAHQLAAAVARETARAHAAWVWLGEGAEETRADRRDADTRMGARRRGPKVSQSRTDGSDSDSDATSGSKDGEFFARQESEDSRSVSSRSADAGDDDMGDTLWMVTSQHLIRLSRTSIGSATGSGACRKFTAATRCLSAVSVARVASALGGVFVADGVTAPIDLFTGASTLESALQGGGGGGWSPELSRRVLQRVLVVTSRFHMCLVDTRAPLAPLAVACAPSRVTGGGAAGDATATDDDGASSRPVRTIAVLHGARVNDGALVFTVTSVRADASAWAVVFAIDVIAQRGGAKAVRGLIVPGVSALLAEIGGGGEGGAWGALHLPSPSQHASSHPRTFLRALQPHYLGQPPSQGRGSFSRRKKCGFCGSPRRVTAGSASRKSSGPRLPRVAHAF